MQEVISDAIFARIKGKSFKENCTTPREDLRYLRVKHYNKDGDVQEGELICHKDIAGVLLNVFYDPYVRQGKGGLRVSPSSSKEYVDRTKEFPYKIVKGDLCYRLFKKYGFIWGGDWKNSKDYQHFEKR